jgi:hypothetical protein
VDIQETRQCNLHNLRAVARYYGTDESVLLGYYEELLEDRHFLDTINEKIVGVSSVQGFKKGIFAKGAVASIDWFAFQRILLYALVRYLRPKWCLETGVYYGGNSVFILNALRRNGAGTLVSIDLPDSQIRKLRGQESQSETQLRRHPLVGDSELYDESLSPGFIIPDDLRSSWRFIQGSSLTVIPTLDERFDFYIHDSDHTFDFVTRELALVQAQMSEDGTMLVDDINWSNAFFKFCVDGHFYPLCLTDNGKNNLDVRTGLVFLKHPYNEVEAISGGAVR